jgi:hypothetical protein
LLLPHRVTGIAFRAYHRAVDLALVRAGQHDIEACLLERFELES